jgi:hypothetical protein
MSTTAVVLRLPSPSAHGAGHAFLGDLQRPSEAVANKPQEPTIAAAAIAAQRQRRWTDETRGSHMTEPLARSILKLIAIVTVLVGSIQTAQSLVSWAIFNDPVGPSIYVSHEDLVFPIRMGVFLYVVIIVLGFLLLALSPLLARHVAGRMPSN